MNDDSWKRTHLHDPNRKPLWECPHCDEKRYSVIGCWGIKKHLWEVHGIPGKWKFNGHTIYYGEKNEITDT